MELLELYRAIFFCLKCIEPVEHQLVSLEAANINQKDSFPYLFCLSYSLKKTEKYVMSISILCS